MKIMSYPAFTVWFWLWPWKLNRPDFHFLLPEVPDWTGLDYIPRETKEREASSRPQLPQPILPQHTPLQFLPSPQVLGGCFSHSSIFGHDAFLEFMMGPAFLLLVLDRWMPEFTHESISSMLGVKRPLKYIYYFDYSLD